LSACFIKKIESFLEHWHAVAETSKCDYIFAGKKSFLHYVSTASVVSLV